MRNLRLLKSHRCLKLQGPGTPQCFTVRTDTGTVLIASEYSVTELDTRAGQVVNEVSLTVERYLPEDGGGTVVGIQDLPDQGPVAQNQDKGLSQDILVILAQLIRNPVALKMDRGQEDMLWYKLPWRFILWSQPAPDQAKFQDLFNLIPNVSQQSPQMETNSYFTAHYTLLSHNQTHCHYLNVCDH